MNQVNMDGGVNKSVWPYHRNEKYPAKLHTNWRQIKMATLRRYVRYHDINMRHDCSPDEYSIAVARHFGTRHKVHPNQVLHKFMYTIQRQNRRENMIPKNADTNHVRNVFNEASAWRNAYTGDNYREFVSSSSKKRSGRDAAVSSSKEDSKRRKKSHSEGDYSGETIEVFWGPPHNRWFKAKVKDFNVTRKGFSTLIYRDNSEEYVQLLRNGVGKALGDGGKLESMRWRLKASKQNNQHTAKGSTKSSQRKTKKSKTSPVVETSQKAYKDMIKRALREIAERKGDRNGELRGTFKEICTTMKRLFTNKLNWTHSGDARKTPVWKTCVRKILFSDLDFKRTKGPGPSGAHIFCCV